jgi:hypothetical protein
MTTAELKDKLAAVKTNLTAIGTRTTENAQDYDLALTMIAKLEGKIAAAEASAAPEPKKDPEAKKPDDKPARVPKPAKEPKTPKKVAEQPVTFVMDEQCDHLDWEEEDLPGLYSLKVKPGSQIVGDNGMVVSTAQKGELLYAFGKDCGRLVFLEPGDLAVMKREFSRLRNEVDKLKDQHDKASEALKEARAAAKPGGADPEAVAKPPSRRPKKPKKRPKPPSAKKDR